MGVSSVVYIQNTMPFSHLKVSVVPWDSFLSTDNTKIAFWAQKALSPGGVSVWISLSFSRLCLWLPAQPPVLPRPWAGPTGSAPRRWGPPVQPPSQTHPLPVFVQPSSWEWCWHYLTIGGKTSKRNISWRMKMIGNSNFEFTKFWFSSVKIWGKFVFSLVI